MTRLLDIVRHQFSPQREPNLEKRLFQLICLAAAFLSLAIVAPVNYLQDLPWSLNAVVTAFGLISIALYRASLRGSHHMKTFASLVGVVLNLCWFTDAGSQGSIGMFFFAGVMVMVTSSGDGSAGCSWRLSSRMSSCS